MKNTLTLLLLLLFGASGFSQNYIGKQKHIDAILKNAAQFSKDLINKNVDGIVNTYTTDAKLFPTGREILDGTEDITTYWTPREGYTTLTHKLTPIEIKVKGKEARDYGYYEGTSQNPEGEVFSWRGKYLVIWKRVGKEWKMYLDIWNRIDDKK